MRAICIIPARSGSKRIKDKNIIDFEGMPLIAYTILAAIESKQFEKVYVATDSEIIAQIATKYGAEVPFLRTEDADDFTPISIATINFYKRIQSITSESYDVVCQAMANCPLRGADDFVNAIDEYSKGNSESLISGFHYGMFNPWWAYRMDENNQYSLLFPKVKDKRSQDLPELICPSGAIWISSTKSLETSGSFYSPDFRFFVMNWINSVDIDDYKDLEIAKIIYHYLNR